MVVGLNQTHRILGVCLLIQKLRSKKPHCFAEMESKPLWLEAKREERGWYHTQLERLAGFLSLPKEQCCKGFQRGTVPPKIIVELWKVDGGGEGQVYRYHGGISRLSSLQKRNWGGGVGWDKTSSSDVLFRSIFSSKGPCYLSVPFSSISILSYPFFLFFHKTHLPCL